MSGARAVRISSLWDWAGCVADLAREGPLPVSTVIVQQQAVAQALRRELCSTGRGDALLGAAFIRPLSAALAVLEADGVVATAAEGSRRALRIRSLLTSDIGLRYFRGEGFRTGLGWDEAMSRTISRLEAGGLAPKDLLSHNDSSGRLSDLAVIWERLEATAGTSWTPARVLAEAAERLQANPGLWPYDGPTLAAVNGDIDMVTAQFLRAIPGVCLGVLVSRPAREHYLARLDALFGADVAAAAALGPTARPGTRELDVLSEMLFEAPEKLGAADRPRSSGPDGTVVLEEHAGVEEEIEAAVDWVGRLVLEDGVPLEQIALLLPRMDPLAAMVVDRLGRLPTAVPSFVSGGLPLAREAAGTRVLGVLRALRGYLDIESMASILGYLRPAGTAERRLSCAEAVMVAGMLGTVGGSVERREGALEWAACIERRRAELALRCAAAPGHPSSDRQAREDADLLDCLARVGPAVEALTAVASAVVGRQPLPVLWPLLGSFLENWVLLPGDGAPLPRLLEGALASFCDDHCATTLTGTEAIAAVEDVLLGLRTATGRFGDPAVFVGTVRAAAGLSFKAVRFLGLAEGAFPGVGREDPVLPLAIATGFGSALLSPDDRMLADLHRVARLVRDTTGTVVLSAPRRTLEGTEREPSFILLEVAAALGRPDVRTGGQKQSSIPDAVALARTAFLPARAAARGWRLANPLTATAFLDRAAVAGEIPPSWTARPMFDLQRIRKLMQPGAFGAMDGLLGDTARLLKTPGFSAERPISASGLRELLECPHRFLLARLLGWREPGDVPGAASIVDPAPYGTLFHALVEEFFREYGTPFGRRERTLVHWQGIGAALADAAFRQLLGSYPLSGEGATDQQRKRLLEDMASYLKREWEGERRRYVGVEKPFGWADDPVALTVGKRQLFVHGSIDRLDVEGDTVLVRDVKTGKAHPRTGDEQGPVPVLDVQVGLYGLVLSKMAGTWKLPARVAVAYEYVGRGEGRREFVADYEVLARATMNWLKTATALLAEGRFPRTPNADPDCRYCSFLPVCGDEGAARAPQVLANSTGALALFQTLKDAEE